MKNKEIRRMIEQANLRYWQVAEAMGISAATLCVWLRKELKGEQLQRVRQAIEMLRGNGGDSGERTENHYAGT